MKKYMESLTRERGRRHGRTLLMQIFYFKFVGAGNTIYYIDGILKLPPAAFNDSLGIPATTLTGGIKHRHVSLLLRSGHGLGRNPYFLKRSSVNKNLLASASNRFAGTQ